MQVALKEQMAVQLADCMSRLKALGLKGEVAVTAGVVMVSTTDKNSASQFRKAMKKVAERTGTVFVENRPSKESRVFTLAV